MNQTSKNNTSEISISKEKFIELSEKINSIPKIKESLIEIESMNISEIINIIIFSGVVFSFSDIHIEPEKETVKLRARIDGVLQEIVSFNSKSGASIVSRIKLLSNIKLNVTESSQDGGFSFKIKDDLIEIRTSSIPSEYGESIVLRVLNPKKLVEIKDLGLRKDLVSVVEEEIKKPNGMIIVTGPTGSGKTTTLYAIIKKIKNPEIKIITIEDPVEYHLDGISQTEVHEDKGYNFSSGLRSIVRQDPDVILVGEIRDEETAQVAIQSALTGHLVLTTLHTNDAAGAIARLHSLGEKSHNIAPGVNIVIAQRLIRKVCPYCFKKEKVSINEYEKIDKALKSLPEGLISYSKESEISKACGCEKCNNTGYKGRVGIFEILKVNSVMEKTILTSNSSYDIKEKAIESGMTTIYQDGMIKVLSQETTIEEIERVSFEK
jgi:general secretion pathway protein E